MRSNQQRKKVLAKLMEYFEAKGKVLSQNEYIAQDDKPYLLSGIRSMFRSYAHMLQMVINLQNSKPQPVGEVTPGKTPDEPVVVPTLTADKDIEPPKLVKDEHGITPPDPRLQPSGSRPAPQVK